MRLASQEQKIRQYLLSDPCLSEEAKTAIEKSYFGDDAVHEDVLAIEDELIDAYVSGELNPQERDLFEASLMRSTRWQEKVAFVISLRAYAARIPAEPAVSGKPSLWWQRLPSVFARPGYGLPIAVAVLILAAFVALNVRERLQKLATARPSTDQSPRQTNGTLPVPPSRNAKATPSPTPVLSFVLASDLVRANGRQAAFQIPPGLYDVKLEMQRQTEPYRFYDATLSTPEGRIIAHQAHLSPKVSGRSTTVVMMVSSARLRRGVYILNLAGEPATGAAEGLDDYTFEVADH